MFGLNPGLVSMLPIYDTLLLRVLSVCSVYIPEQCVSSYNVRLQTQFLVHYLWMRYNVFAALNCRLFNSSKLL
jgi:hypothetical protein